MGEDLFLSTCRLRQCSLNRCEGKKHEVFIFQHDTNLFKTLAKLQFESQTGRLFGQNSGACLVEDDDILEFFIASRFLRGQLLGPLGVATPTFASEDQSIDGPKQNHDEDNEAEKESNIEPAALLHHGLKRREGKLITKST